MVAMPVNTTKILAEFAITAKLNDLLAELITPVIADCFGCIIAGSNSQVAIRSYKSFKKFGSGDSTLFGTNKLLNLQSATVCNSVAGHAWDFDDYEAPGNTHPTVVILPAMLSASHLQKTSGTELLIAYAVGVEVIMQLGQAITLEHYARGFHSTATLGAIGAAAAVSRLLHLSKEQTSNALAIAVSQAIGYTAQFGSNAKGIQTGFAARAGLEAAVLAESGATGNLDIIESDSGFFALLGQHDKDRIDLIENKIGNKWALLEHGVYLKPWPVCSYTHRAITAALDIRKRLKNQLDQITEVRVVMPDFHYAILPFKIPQNHNEALFSLPACLAKILIDGTLTLKDYENSFWEKSEIQQLIKKVFVKTEPARNLSLNFDPEQPDHLSIKLEGGELIESKCAFPLGSPQNPMNLDQLSGKFQSITGYSAERFQNLLKWPQTSDVLKFFREASDH